MIFTCIAVSTYSIVVCDRYFVYYRFPSLQTKKAGGMVFDSSRFLPGLVNRHCSKPRWELTRGGHTNDLSHSTTCSNS